MYMISSHFFFNGTTVIYLTLSNYSSIIYLERILKINVVEVQRMIKKFEIYQLKEEHIYDLGFMRYEYLMKHGKTVEKKNYCLMYKSADIGIDCSDDAYLELLYERFNLNRPEDFKGHSMSVSDVVVINGNAYYTDSFGFQRLERF